jgi:2-polyprenyl-6-methoxyphenol hydroxylase-like FAD-dependent oxidoreductase
MMTEETVADVYETTCCVVGGGPAGVIAAFLLARQGVAVTLMEAHHDFDRDFRGDTIHPSTLELLDRLGLADRLLARPHRKMTRMVCSAETGTTTLIDLARLRSKFPYIAIMPQSEFLGFLADEAGKLPTFKLVLGANVQRLVEEGGAVRGVRYQEADGLGHEVRAPLTIGADGRFSRLRKLAGFELTKFAPPMDVLWLRLPRRPSDPEDLGGVLHIRGGRFVVMFDRPGDEWQVGYVILKGSFAEIKAQGIEALRSGLAETVPVLADRVKHVRDFHDVTVLSVEVARLSCWHRPGLLLIGDAAHVMSPVGGIGIQYAVQDAVAAANLLGKPLLGGTVSDDQLAAVQARRERAVRRGQGLQKFLQERIVAQALKPSQPFRLPWYMRLLSSLPIVRGLPARIIGRGFDTVELEV